ncbi:hypothetical protein FFLO_00651 [Filobasidium floriforme]|uniref:Small ribosomal subunit protein uS13m n=1 Tax=Filobasidium floriforme TaxID=5210 RepID=A0A8K0JRP0_9TREE|nr:hypothetical protein FFLO_00651 [Filobasidium floriforme]
MHLLGHNLPDHKLLRVALTSFYGISHHISYRLLARLQIHSEATVSNLTEAQVTALSAYLSSPSTNPSPDPTPICPPGQQPSTKGKEREVVADREDPLDTLKIETDLRRSLQSDIAHHRTIGTYRGKRHAASLPVRGQRTRTNAKTAKKINRVDRRAFSSYTLSSIAPSRFGRM